MSRLKRYSAWVLSQIEWVKFHTVRKWFFHEDGEPIRCPLCLSNDIQVTTIDSIDWMPSEIKMTCKNCANPVGYWAYGHYEPEYMKLFCRSSMWGQSLDIIFYSFGRK